MGYLDTLKPNQTTPDNLESDSDSDVKIISVQEGSVRSKRRIRRLEKKLQIGLKRTNLGGTFQSMKS